MKILFTILSLVILSACASGTALVTGNLRPAIKAEAVTMYYKEPANYEVIAIVKASSTAGWTDQAALDYAIEELKSQAAKVGANGVLFETAGEESRGSVGAVSGGVFMSGAGKTTQMVSGQAIYVN